MALYEKGYSLVSEVVFHLLESQDRTSNTLSEDATFGHSHVEMVAGHCGFHHEVTKYDM